MKLKLEAGKDVRKRESLISDPLLATPPTDSAILVKNLLIRAKMISKVFNFFF